MANEINNNDFFASGGNTDDDMNLDKLFIQEEAKTNTSSTVMKPKNEKPLSPLQQMRKEQEERGLGAVVANKDLEEKKLKHPVFDDEERIEEFEKRENELDESLEKRRHVVVIKHPSNAAEFAKMMLEVDSVVIDSNGEASLNYMDKDGNSLTPEFIRLRKEGEEAFDLDGEKRRITSINNNESSNTDNNISNDTTTPTPDNNEDAEKEAELKKTVEILIDKTGLGTDFILNDVEKDKIIEADEIKLNEIEFVDIESFMGKRSEKSFQDSIAEYQLSNSKTTICFPASGFRAQMKGLTYGEMSDISLSMDSVTFDQYFKRLSIIYNKMININVGPFKSFNDFLKGFAYVDISMALYGLYISTQSEVQTIQLRCGKTGCEKGFNWDFNTRSIIRLEKCTPKFLEKMKEIATAPPTEYDNIRKNSAVLNSKYIRLPGSRFVVEMGIISAYEFLYNFVPIIDEDKFKEEFGDDVSGIYKNNILFLTTVRSIRIPNDDGTYTLCETYKDILDAIYNIDPSDFKILAALTNKYTGEYNSYFSFGDVTCPHCGNVTHDLTLTMDELVFQTFRRLMNTDINVENMQDF